MENKNKWICGDKRSRFTPPDDDKLEALIDLTDCSTASLETIKLLRILGADIHAVMISGKNEISV